MSRKVPNIRDIKFFDIDSECEMGESKPFMTNQRESVTPIQSDMQVQLSEETYQSPRSDEYSPGQSFGQFTEQVMRHSSEYSGSSWRSTPFGSNQPLGLHKAQRIPSIKLRGEISSNQLAVNRKKFRSKSYSPSPESSRNEQSRMSSKRDTVESQKSPPNKDLSSYAAEDTYRSNKSINSSHSRINEDHTPMRHILQRLEIPKYIKNIESIQEERKEDSYSLHIGNEKMAIYQGSPFTDQEIKEAFDTFDMDTNQYISADEIRTIMDTIGEYVTDEEIDEMIRMLDLEGKGQVGFAEFYKMATGQPTGPLGGALPPSPSMEPMGNSTFKSSYKERISTSKSLKSNESGKMSSSKLSKMSHDSRKESDERSKAKRDTGFEKQKILEEKLAPKVLRKFDIETLRSQVPTQQVESIASIESKKNEDVLLPPVRVRSFKEQLTTPKLNTSKSSETNSKSWKIAGESTPEEYKSIIVPTLDESHEQQSNQLLTELVHSTQLTPQAVEKLINMFIEKTGSESGQLSYDKFLDMVNSKLPQERWLIDDRVTRRIFSVLDRDSNGTWSIREFVQALSVLARPNKDDQYALVFKIFDTDDDEIITKNELARILKLNTASVKSDEQAMKKAQEILRMTGNDEMMNFQDFLRLKEKPVMLLFPLQERASKITKLLA